MKKFEERVMECILSDTYINQAMEDLDTVVWSKDSVARSQFWEIGENEDTLFGKVMIQNTDLGYWPKEVEKTLIGYSNAIFGDKIFQILYRDLGELFDCSNPLVVHFISHLCFMCCRCIAAVNARKEELLRQDFIEYFNLVARKLEAYYQLKKFDEHSFPKCELIALKFLADNFHEIFEDAKETNGHENSLKKRPYKEGAKWALEADDFSWSFTTRGNGKKTIIRVWHDKFDISTYELCRDFKEDEDGILPEALSNDITIWFNSLLSGQIPESTDFKWAIDGISHNGLTVSWNLAKVVPSSDAIEGSIMMNDELIAKILHWLQDEKFGY